VTIDGETARDFDDAIAVAALPRGGFRLWVHIADVAHFVPAGGEIDLEARRRGTSVYFPERVVPMLPEALSNELCSLRPGEDRLVQSVVLDFTAQGKLRGARFADGIIRSAARLTYTKVGALLDGGKRGHGVPKQLVPMLLAANELRAALERRRHARGSIDFDLPEPEILLDVEGAMTGISIAPRRPWPSISPGARCWRSTACTTRPIRSSSRPSGASSAASATSCGRTTPRPFPSASSACSRTSRAARRSA
jgi:ribonuclease R